SSNPEECLWFIFALRCRLGDAPDQYRHPVRLGLAQANLLVSLNYDLVRETNSKAEEPPIAARTRETRKVDPRDETRIPDEVRQARARVDEAPPSKFREECSHADFRTLHAAHDNIRVYVRDRLPNAPHLPKLAEALVRKVR